jgi:hypothetical protein
MMARMKHRLRCWSLSAVTFVLLIAAHPLVALAQEEEDKIYDARLEGYPGRVTLDSWSTALMWLLLVVLGAICIGVMFKNARRTHLD